MPESTAVKELAEQDSPFPQEEKDEEDEPTSNADRTFVVNDFSQEEPPEDGV